MSVVPAAVRVLSRARGVRVIHPRGTAFTARVTVTGGAFGCQLLDTPSSYDGVVRLSRSAGLPAPLPDVLGLAVRVSDAYGPGRHQDLLLDSCAAAPVLRRLPVPRRRAAVFGSLLPYSVGGRRLLLGAWPTGERSWALLVATAHGPWQPWGWVVVTGPLLSPAGQRLVFDPWTTGPDLQPAGLLNRLRRGAYPASHVAPAERPLRGR